MLAVRVGVEVVALAVHVPDAIAVGVEEAVLGDAVAVIVHRHPDAGAGGVVIVALAPAQEGVAGARGVEGAGHLDLQAGVDLVGVDAVVVPALDRGGAGAAVQAELQVVEVGLVVEHQLRAAIAGDVHARGGAAGGVVEARDVAHRVVDGGGGVGGCRGHSLGEHTALDASHDQRVGMQAQVGVVGGGAVVGADHGAVAQDLVGVGARVVQLVDLVADHDAAGHMVAGAVRLVEEVEGGAQRTGLGHGQEHVARLGAGRVRGVVTGHARACGRGVAGRQVPIAGNAVDVVAQGLQLHAVGRGRAPALDRVGRVGVVHRVAHGAHGVDVVLAQVLDAAVAAHDPDLDVVIGLVRVPHGIEGDLGPVGASHLGHLEGVGRGDEPALARVLLLEGLELLGGLLGGHAGLVHGARVDGPAPEGVARALHVHLGGQLLLLAGGGGAVGLGLLRCVGAPPVVLIGTRLEADDAAQRQVEDAELGPVVRVAAQVQHARVARDVGLDGLGGSIVEGHLSDHSGRVGGLVAQVAQGGRVDRDDGAGGVARVADDVVIALDEGGVAVAVHDPVLHAVLGTVLDGLEEDLEVQAAVGGHVARKLLVGGREGGVPHITLGRRHADLAFGVGHGAALIGQHELLVAVGDTLVVGGVEEPGVGAVGVGDPALHVIGRVGQGNEEELELGRAVAQNRGRVHRAREGQVELVAREGADLDAEAAGHDRHGAQAVDVEAVDDLVDAPDVVGILDHGDLGARGARGGEGVPGQVEAGHDGAVGALVDHGVAHHAVALHREAGLALQEDGLEGLAVEGLVGAVGAPLRAEALGHERMDGLVVGRGSHHGAVHEHPVAGRVLPVAEVPAGLGLGLGDLGHARHGGEGVLAHTDATGRRVIDGVVHRDVRVLHEHGGVVVHVVGPARGLDGGGGGHDGRAEARDLGAGGLVHPVPAGEAEAGRRGQGGRALGGRGVAHGDDLEVAAHAAVIAVAIEHALIGVGLDLVHHTGHLGVGQGVVELNHVVTGAAEVIGEQQVAGVGRDDGVVGPDVVGRGDHGGVEQRVRAGRPDPPTRCHRGGHGGARGGVVHLHEDVAAGGGRVLDHGHGGVVRAIGHGDGAGAVYLVGGLPRLLQVLLHREGHVVLGHDHRSVDVPLVDVQTGVLGVVSGRVHALGREVEVVGDDVVVLVDPVLEVVAGDQHELGAAGRARGGRHILAVYAVAREPAAGRVAHLVLDMDVVVLGEDGVVDGVLVVAGGALLDHEHRVGLDDVVVLVHPVEEVVAVARHGGHGIGRVGDGRARRPIQRVAVLGRELLGHLVGPRPGHEVGRAVGAAVVHGDEVAVLVHVGPAERRHIDDALADALGVAGDVAVACLVGGLAAVGHGDGLLAPVGHQRDVVGGRRHAAAVVRGHGVGRAAVGPAVEHVAGLGSRAGHRQGDLGVRDDRDGLEQADTVVVGHGCAAVGVELHEDGQLDPLGREREAAHGHRLVGELGDGLVEPAIGAQPAVEEVHRVVAGLRELVVLEGIAVGRAVIEGLAVHGHRVAHIECLVGGEKLVDQRVEGDGLVGVLGGTVALLGDLAVGPDGGAVVAGVVGHAVGKLPGGPQGGGTAHVEAAQAEVRQGLAVGIVGVHEARGHGTVLENGLVLPALQDVVTLALGDDVRGARARVVVHHLREGVAGHGTAVREVAVGGVAVLELHVVEVLLPNGVELVAGMVGYLGVVASEGALISEELVAQALHVVLHVLGVAGRGAGAGIALLRHSPGGVKGVDGARGPAHEVVAGHVVLVLGQGARHVELEGLVGHGARGGGALGELAQVGVELHEEAALGPDGREEGIVVGGDGAEVGHGHGDAVHHLGDDHRVAAAIGLGVALVHRVPLGPAEEGVVVRHVHRVDNLVAVLVVHGVALRVHARDLHGLGPGEHATRVAVLHAVVGGQATVGVHVREARGALEALGVTSVVAVVLIEVAGDGGAVGRVDHGLALEVPDLVGISPHGDEGRGPVHGPGGGGVGSPDGQVGRVNRVGTGVLGGCRGRGTVGGGLPDLPALEVLLVLGAHDDLVVVGRGAGVHLLLRFAADLALGIVGAVEGHGDGLGLPDRREGHDVRAGEVHREVHEPAGDPGVALLAGVGVEAVEVPGERGGTRHVPAQELVAGRDEALVGVEALVVAHRHGVVLGAVGQKHAVLIEERGVASRDRLAVGRVGVRRGVGGLDLRDRGGIARQEEDGVARGHPVGRQVHVMGQHREAAARAVGLAEGHGLRLARLVHIGPAVENVAHAVRVVGALLSGGLHEVAGVVQLAAHAVVEVAVVVGAARVALAIEVVVHVEAHVLPDGIEHDHGLLGAQRQMEHARAVQEAVLEHVLDLGLGLDARHGVARPAAEDVAVVHVAVVHGREVDLLVHAHVLVGDLDRGRVGAVVVVADRVGVVGEARVPAGAVHPDLVGAL